MPHRSSPSSISADSGPRPRTDSAEEVDGADSLRQTLRTQIRRRLRQRNGHEEARGVEAITSVSVQVPGEVRPLNWLRAQPTGEALYWSGRDDDVEIAAMGAADRIGTSNLPVDVSALEERLDRRLERGSGVRYFGGLRFDAEQPAAASSPDDRWRPFGAARFVLPRFLLRRTPAGTALTCRLVLPRDHGRREALEQAIDALVFPRAQAPASLPPLLERTDAPSHARWKQMVEWALRHFDGGALHKVVLARRVALRFARRIGPFHVLQHLRDATHGCFHFAVRPAAPAAWIGASPERLFRRTGSTVVSEAVAGTRSRGDSAQADAALRDELMQSPKDRREHAFVEDAIRDRLQSLCTSVEVDEETSEMELERGRHLHSQVRGTLRPTATSLDVLAALHPTPAVGGVPHRRALTAIRRKEPFDRGWYAGPVGWIGTDEAEFAVAIRAGLVRGDAIDLFSGAGLVAGSEPDAEWDEIEQKIGDFAAVLGIGD